MLKQMLKKSALGCFLLGTLMSTTAVQAQDLSAPIPTDSKVESGKLANGLTYYIRPNSKPENKVELRLVVNAGSILEDDTQLGLAHFMEHMNFNGTKNFEKNDLVDYLQSIGVDFGADLNAYTGFDQTVYILPIPTDKPGNLEKGFQIIEDWAHNALLTDKDIDEERNVVLEESRLGKGADDRMAKKYLPKMLSNSRYADRLPIGKDEILKNFKHDEVRRFYRDWYRPNEMAVIVVGDITVEKAKEMINKHFAGLTNPANQRERIYPEVKPYSEASAMVLSDPEATNFEFNIMFSSRKKTEEKTLKDYRDYLIRNLFNQMLNKRFQDLSQSATPPFVFAVSYIGGYARGYESLALIAIPASDINTAINATIAELLKAQQYGFTNTELELAKKNMLSSVEKQYNERNTTESGRYVNEYIQHFLDKEPYPGIENEYQYAKEMLPTITLEEVGKEANNWIATDKTKEYFALVTAPEKEDQKLPTDAELLKTVQSAFQQKVTAHEEKKVAEKLLKQDPTPGKIVSETKNEKLGTITYTLSNGIKVTVKSTDFRSDEILFRGIKPGGYNNYGAEDKANTKFLSEVMESMGYGDFTPTDLNNALSGKTIELQQKMDEISNLVEGSSSIKDFPTLMELAYLQLTEPRLDEDLYKGFMGKMKTQLMFLKSNPQVAFIDTLIKKMYNNDPRRPIAVPTTEDINSIDAARVIEIFKNEFTNADGFHFFLVGNVDESNLKPLLEKYIASLPVKGKKPSFKDNGLRMVSGTQKFIFKKGSEQKSLIFGAYHGEVAYSEDLALQTDMLGEILNIKVIEEMREKMGAIYGGGFNASMKRDPYPHYTIMLQLPCGPNNVDPLLQAANEEIDRIRKNGPEEKDLAKVKASILEKHRENLMKNNYWMSKLQQILYWNYSEERFLNAEDVVNKITVNDIKATADKLFSGHQFIGVLYPEKIEAEKADSEK